MSGAQNNSSNTAACLLILALVFYGLLQLPPGLALVSGIVVLSSLWLTQRSIQVFRLGKLTIPGFWYLLYLILIFVPACFVFNEQEGPFRYSYLLAVESVLMTVPTGMLIVTRLLRFAPREVTAYFERGIEKEAATSRSERVFLFFLGGAVAIAILHVIELKTVPVLYLLRNPGDYFELVFLREESLKLLDSPFKFAYGVLQQMFFPFVIVLGLGRYLQQRDRKSLLLFAASLGAGVFYAGLTIEKYPVAAIAVLSFLFLYLWKGGKVSRKMILFGPALFFAFPLLIVLQQTYGSELGFFDVLGALLERLFYGPADVLYYYFEVFPAQYPHQYGATIGKLAWLVGRPIFDAPNIVGLYIDPYGPSSIHANAAFIGAMHVDFGLTGVLGAGFLAGILMQASQVWILRRRKTVLNLSAYAFLLLAFANLNISPLPVVLLSGGVAFVFLAVWAYQFLERPFRPSGILGLVSPGASKD